MSLFNQGYLASKERRDLVISHAYLLAAPSTFFSYDICCANACLITNAKDIIHHLRVVSEKDAVTDTAELGAASALRKLSDRLPLCIQELENSEVNLEALYV